MKVRHALRGFTLIEVLVALVIVAVGVAAVLGTLTSAANSTIYLRDKTYASWIAMNKLTETRLAAAAPVDGKSDGVLDFGGKHWQWQQEVKPAQISGMKRIDVRVRLLAAARTAAQSVQITDKTSWTFEATGFAGTAVAAPNIVLPIWEPSPPPPAGAAVPPASGAIIKPN